jgi:cytoskeletal protein RodZ
MIQYDAGPGDRSDRPWEDPEKKQKSHARRRRVALPPWALLAILVAIVILLCVSLVLIVRAIRNADNEATPTALPASTAEVAPSATVSLVTPASSITPTATIVLPVDTPEDTPPTEIEPGALVVVTGTGGAALNLRQQPSTYAKVVGTAREGTVLTVLEGPSEADNYVWWKVRAPDGTEGWGAANWLALKTEE